MLVKKQYSSYCIGNLSNFLKSLVSLFWNAGNDNSEVLSVEVLDVAETEDAVFPSDSRGLLNTFISLSRGVFEVLSMIAAFAFNNLFATPSPLLSSANS